MEHRAADGTPAVPIHELAGPPPPRSHTNIHTHHRRALFTPHKPVALGRYYRHTHTHIGQLEPEPSCLLPSLSLSFSLSSSSALSLSRSRSRSLSLSLSRSLEISR